jgi:hypothetical protein
MTQVCSITADTEVEGTPPACGFQLPWSTETDENVLNNTKDETRVYNCDPQTKQQWSQWKSISFISGLLQKSWQLIFFGQTHYIEEKFKIYIYTPPIGLVRSGRCEGV